MPSTITTTTLLVSLPEGVSIETKINGRPQLAKIVAVSSLGPNVNLAKLRNTLTAIEKELDEAQ